MKEVNRPFLYNLNNEQILEMSVGTLREQLASNSIEDFFANFKGSKRIISRTQERVNEICLQNQDLLEGIDDTNRPYLSLILAHNLVRRKNARDSFTRRLVPKLINEEVITFHDTNHNLSDNWSLNIKKLEEKTYFQDHRTHLELLKGYTLPKEHPWRRLWEPVDIPTKIQEDLPETKPAPISVPRASFWEKWQPKSIAGRLQGFAAGRLRPAA